MTIRSAKARTATRRTYLVLYVLVIVMTAWAWSAPPAPVEEWAGRFAVTVWTLLMGVGAVSGFVSARARYVQMERVSSGILAVGMLLFALANIIYDGFDGIRAMYILGSILSVVIFVPIRWHQLNCGYYIEPRPERFEEQRE